MKGVPKFGRKKHLTEYLYSKPVIVVLLIIVIFLSMSVFDRWKVERDMAARRMSTETERALIIDRKQALDEKVQYLKDERGIEEEIRKHFDVAKDGEKVVILLGSDSTNSAPTTTVVSSPNRWWQFWR